MTKILNINVEDIYDNIEAIKLDNLIDSINKIIDKVPKEYKSSLMVKFNCDIGYEGECDPYLSIYYERKETKEEEDIREKEEREEAIKKIEKIKKAYNL